MYEFFIATHKMLRNKFICLIWSEELRPFGSRRYFMSVLRSEDWSFLLHMIALKTIFRKSIQVGGKK